MQSIPGEGPSAMLMRHLKNNRHTTTVIETASLYLNAEYDVLDVIIFLLASPTEFEEYNRRSLLVILRGIVRTSEGIRKFNASREKVSRLSRLRILQEEYNSSLIEGKCVLATVGYFSMLFEKIIARWEIRYTVVLIKSGSMLTHSGDSHLSRWDDAREACEYLVEAMEPLAIDGMTLYMSSSSQVNKCTSLSCAEEVQELFRSVTFDELDEQIDMTVVLSQVFLDHFQHQQMEHVLVITDCEPLNFSSAYLDWRTDF
eukprot:TRINITY_DN3146_c0_g1_i12.p1 TRINITY_DN3146_c0_g1~~TRINITY_DN3146_c0_g1_i12.p1  ORF type:complete len:298 (+),score=40.93 TRINITY_DN3146_c0_g1_i12:122-895(+)